MALDRELRRLLEYARQPEGESSSSKGARPTARSILRRLAAIQQQTCIPAMGVSPDMNLPELLVLTAEAAISQGDFDTASQSVEWFFGECRLKNQFYCRAQFVRAHCGSHDAQSDTGAAKLKKVLNAVHYVMLVLPVATDTHKRPTYDFLVYNASVTYWQIARQLMKQSTFQFLVPSLTKIIEALKLTGGSDLSWLLRLQLALVYAQVDANQLANAAKTINDVVDVQITPRLSDPTKADEMFKALYEEALRIQVHVGSFKDAECQKIVPNVKRLIPSTNKRASLLVKLQCVKSGNLTGSLEAAYVELFQEATSFSAFSGDTPTADVKAFVDSLDANALGNIDPEILVETGIHAAFNNALPTAEACDVVLQKKGKNMPPKVRVLHQVLGAILLVVTSPAHTAGKVSSRQRQSILLARRVEGIKALERALLASKRQQDPQLVERVCICAWNLSLPLLQPHLRSHLSRIFGLSSTVLGEAESMLLGFRARLYLEVAKLEVVSDFLAKAKTNVGKALLLDYGTITRSNDTQPVTLELVSANGDWIARPVDTHLVPLQKKLDLKLSSETEPSKANEVLAMVEQVKEGKDPVQQRSTLVRCVEALNELSSQSCSAAADDVRLWSEVSYLAWNILHDGHLAQEVADKILATYFPISGAGDVTMPSISSEKSLMILEIDTRLLLVEILAMKLKDQATKVENARRQAETSRNESKTRKSPDLDALLLLGKEAYILGIHRSNAEDISTPMDQTGESAVDESVETRKNTLEKDIQNIKVDILKHLTRALKAATRIGWTFILENICIYLWNYHFHIFCMLLESSFKSPNSATATFDPQWILPECLSAFEAAFAALEAANGVDADVLSSVGLGLSGVYKKTGRMDKALAIVDTFIKRSTQASEGATKVSMTYLKRFVELKARAQVAQNAKEIVPNDSCATSLKVVAYLEAMEATFRQLGNPSAQQTQLTEKAQGLYQKAASMWQTAAPELFKSLTSDELGRLLEEVQQQLELYVEVWVRVGCGAFRLRNNKYAVECAEQALMILEQDQTKKAKKVIKQLVVVHTWKWFALAELLYGRAVLALAQNDLPPRRLVLTSLTHLVRAIQYGLRGNSSLLVIRACEVVWNAAISALSEPSDDNADEFDDQTFLSHVVDHLKKTLRYLDQVIATPEADVSFYGEMVLLTLAIFEKANRWSDIYEVCDGILKSFGPTSHRAPLPEAVKKDIHTTYAIAGAHLGKPSPPPKNVGSTKTPDQFQEALVQAEILRKVAFASWKDPPAQLKALSCAHGELDGQPEEQSLVLIDIAEWFFTNQYPSQNVDSYLDCAASTMLACLQQKQLVSQQTISRKASSNSLLPPSASSKQKSSIVYSPIWFAEKLFRTFAMRAIIAKTCTERAKYLQLSLRQVENLWEHILIVANEIDQQNAFDQVKADPANKAPVVDYDEWKKDKPAKFVKPESDRDWVRFFLDYEDNATNRFYTVWSKALQSDASPEVRHVTQPVLTLEYLEKLMKMLREDVQFSSMIPPFGLYLVLFHTYIPQKTYVAQIWVELSQAELLEHLNLTSFALPLQSALDMIQSQGAELIKEMNEIVSTAEQQEMLAGRRRTSLYSDRLDTQSKAVASIELLIRFGLIRQAKTLFEILKHSVSAGAAWREILCQCDVLASRVLEIEGQSEKAMVRMQKALGNPQLDVRHFLEWTLRACKLNPDLTQSHQVLKAAEKAAAKAIVAGMKSSTTQNVGSSTGAVSISPDLDVVQLMSRIILKRATILLKRAASVSSMNVVAVLRESKEELGRSMKMLTLVDAGYESGQALLKYSRALRKFETSTGSSILANIGLDYGKILQESLSFMEKSSERCFRFQFSSTKPSEKMQREALIDPLQLEISLTKLKLAGALMAPQMSAAIVKDKEMTWYRYYEDSQRNVVERWLNSTEASLQTRNAGELPRAMTLITSAIDTLSDNPSLIIQHAIAQVLRFQCQRLLLLHGDDKKTADAIRYRLWTRFTSSDSPHATWVCCHGAQSEAVVAAADAAALQSQIPIQDEELENEDLLQPEGVDFKAMDEMLANRVKMIQKYQLISFEKRCAELLRLSSYEVVQLMGCRHPFDCAKNLLKHQSTEVIETARSLFAKCVSETNVQRLHLRRMKNMQKTHTNAAANSLSYQLSQLYLDQQSEAFKRMSVGTRVDTIIAALPSSVRVLCLHFSPDRCFLYAAILGSTERRVAIGRMEFTESQTALLDRLDMRVKAWRDRCVKETMAYEDAHKQDELFEFAPVEQQTGEASTDDILEEEFTGIVNDTVGLLQPLFSHSSMKAELKTNLANNMLVLLVDQVLAYLPLEALPALQPADSITRDFSIQMLHQRLLAMKRQQLRPTEVRFIVDPHNEDPGNASGQTMTSVVKQGCGTWKDAFDHGQIPSVTDWQQALNARRGGGLLYVGPNRILGSCLPLKQVTGMNIALTCQALILLDHAENAKSTRRQSKLDSEKPRWEMEVEKDPYERALLLTLCGANVLALNQWTTTFNGNRRLANGLLQGISKGYSVGRALKRFSESTIATASAPQALGVAATASDASLSPGSPTAASDSNTSNKLQQKNRFRYNPVVYGLANLVLRSGD